MHRIRAYLVTPLLFALLASAVYPTLATAVPDSAAAHRAAAEAAKAKAARQQKISEQLKSQTDALDKKVDSLQAEADELDPQIATASKRVDALRGQIARMRSSIASMNADVAQAEAEYIRQQTLLGDRVTASYRQDDWYFLDLLLDSKSIRDLIVRTDLLSRVLRANVDMAEQLDSTRRSLETQRSKLDRSLASITAKRQEASAVETNLKQLRDARQGKVDEQSSVLSEKSQLLAKSVKSTKQLLAIARAEEAESARIEAELARAKRGSGKYHGVMAWPVPGFERITSPFGMRMHPILKVKRMHTGIDIGKNPGQPIAGAAIVASGKGTVISAGSRSGYGNTVMIDHGNGVVTLYAHQPSGGIRVSVGEHVKKGQRIGTVGMSGYATGPHLHFEVRVNGSPVNPMGYL
jgi:murein DD-endopeptidase MepM/ murein hydrolase activator NlpD